MWSSVPPVQSDSRILWSTVSLERTNSYPRFYAGRYWIKEGIMWDCQFFLGEARFVPQTIFLKEPQHPQKYQNLCWINLQNIWFSDVCRGYWVEFSRFSIITETHVCSKMFFFEKIFTYVGRIHTIPCLIIWGGEGGGGIHCTFWEKTPQVHWIIIREWPKNTTHHILRNLDNFPHGAFYPPPNNYARKSNDWFILKDKHWTKVSVLQHATALIFKRWCLFKSKRRTLHFQRESSLLSTAEENVEPSQASVMELHHRLLTWL